MMFSEEDNFWIERAIRLAEEAGRNNEVPVGALLVLENKIIGEGSNRPIAACDPSAHAEIIALRSAAKNIGNYRLNHSTLYVTLEPCIMCVGAIVHARVKRVVFGARDPKSGAVESVFEFGKTDKLNHVVNYEGGLREAECGKLLSDFFRARR